MECGRRHWTQAFEDTPHLAEGEVCPQTIPQTMQLRLS